MNLQYQISLNNEYEFKHYCACKSIEVFNSLSNQKNYPSRNRLFTLLVLDLIYLPFHFLHEISQLFLNISNLFFSLYTPSCTFRMNMIVKPLELAGYHLATLLICSAIRIGATALGILNPAWAMKGWSLAEKTSLFYYNSWNQNSQKLPQNTCPYPVHAKIRPSNAIFYLGLDQTLSVSKGNCPYLSLEREITKELSHLICYIACTHFEIFKLLFYYNESVTSRNNEGFLKRGFDYFISPDVKKILLKLETSFQLDEHSTEQKIENWVRQQISKALSIEKKKRLFKHISINFKNILISNNENIDKEKINGFFILLDNLFSQYFRWGRAEFPLKTNHPFLYSNH